jgi:flavin-binding protein dodecin
VAGGRLRVRRRHLSRNPVRAFDGAIAHYQVGLKIGFRLEE